MARRTDGSFFLFTLLFLIKWLPVCVWRSYCCGNLQMEQSLLKLVALFQYTAHKTFPRSTGRGSIQNDLFLSDGTGFWKQVQVKFIMSNSGLHIDSEPAQKLYIDHVITMYGMFEHQVIFLSSPHNAVWADRSTANQMLSGIIKLSFHCICVRLDPVECNIEWHF